MKILVCVAAVSVLMHAGGMASSQPLGVIGSAGVDLQAAINRTRPGDVVLLEPGALYVGNFTLPETSGSQYITIRSRAPASRFPQDGRVGPEHAQWMPTLRSPNGAAVLATAPGAHHWRLQWLAFEANVDGAVVQSGSILQMYGRRNGRPRTIVGFQLTNNLMLHNQYGVIGDEAGVGRAAFAEYLSREDIRGNVLAGADPSRGCGSFLVSTRQFVCERATAPGGIRRSCQRRLSVACRSVSRRRHRRVDGRRRRRRAHAGESRPGIARPPLSAPATTLA